MKPLQVKLRRLVNEIANIKAGIKNTKELIKYDPYKEDLPGLKKGLAEWEENLRSAESEMIGVKESIEKRKHLERSVA